MEKPLLPPHYDDKEIASLNFTYHLYPTRAYDPNKCPISRPQLTGFLGMLSHRYGTALVNQEEVPTELCNKTVSSWRQNWENFFSF